NESDDNWTLCKGVNKRKSPLKVNIKKQATMVMEELQRQFCKPGEPLTRNKLPPSGPIIKNERTRRPYSDSQFRPEWRRIANAAKVPKEIKNADSRAPARLDRLNPAYRHLLKKEIDSAH